MFECLILKFELVEFYMYCIVPFNKIETRGVKVKNKTRDLISQKYAAANFYNNGL